MAYKSSRRQWVKLWVNEWLDGTTRFELTAQQRLLWVDLLALAGRSRFPGFIYAGEGESGKKVGYPIAYLSGVLQMDEVTLNNALKLLEAHHHITLEEITSEKYMIGIVNWEKYQSEYLRQRTYRKVTTKNTKRLPVEGEVEGEGEEDKISLTREIGSGEFQCFWEAYPRHEGKKDALKVWVKKGLDGRLGEILAGLETWKKRREPQYMPYAQGWLNQDAWKELPLGNGKRFKHEEGRNKTKAAIANILAASGGVAGQAQLALQRPAGRGPDSNIPRRPGTE